MLGRNCVVGRGVDIGIGVIIGDNWAVIVSDVPAFALVVGVPGRHSGWVGPAGVPLVGFNASRWRCPRSGEVYVEADGVLTLEKPIDA